MNYPHEGKVESEIQDLSVDEFLNPWVDFFLDKWRFMTRGMEYNDSVQQANPIQVFNLVQKSPSMARAYFAFTNQCEWYDASIEFFASKMVAMNRIIGRSALEYKNLIREFVDNKIAFAKARCPTVAQLDMACEDPVENEKITASIREVMHKWSMELDEYIKTGSDRFMAAKEQALRYKKVMDHPCFSMGELSPLENVGFGLLVIASCSAVLEESRVMLSFFDDEESASEQVVRAVWNLVYDVSRRCDMEYESLDSVLLHAASEDGTGFRLDWNMKNLYDYMLTKSMTVQERIICSQWAMRILWDALERKGFLEEWREFLPMPFAFAKKES